MDATPSRVLLVGEDLALIGLEALLARTPDLEVIGSARTMSAGLAQAHRLRPDLVVLDVRLPDGSGIDACRDILSSLPQTRILFLTSYSDEEAIVSTVMAGASGYLMKEIGQHALIRAITDAAAGRPILDSRSTQPVETKIKNVALSPQERRVLALVVEGKTNKEIAAALYLSDKTVKHYLSNACVKLGVSRRSQAAVIFARQEGKG